MPDETLRFLSDADLQLLTARVRHVSAHRGEVLLEHGVYQRNLYLIREGYVRVELPSQDHGIAVARLGPGQVFGEMSFLEDTGTSASVIAEEDVTVDVIDGAYLQSLLTSDPGFSARLFQSLAVCMAARLRRTNATLLTGLAQDSAGTRGHTDRTGQITDRQMPPDLVRGVERFKSELQRVAEELSAGRLTESAAQPRIDEACGNLRKLLDEYTQQDALLEIGYDDVLSFRDPAQLAQGVGGYVFRETFPLFMASATMARCYMKPHGYAGDPETLQRIYDNEPTGDGRLGPYLDRWFLSRPVCEALRQNRLQMRGVLQKALTSSAPTGPARLTTVGAATANLLLDLLPTVAGPIYATCIDHDADALRTAAETASDLGCADRVTFLQADVVDLAKGLGQVTLGPQRLICGLGLGNVLTDADLQAFLTWSRDHLEPGGSVALTNLSPVNPDQGFMAHILEWTVHARSEDQLRNLFAQAKFDRAAIAVQKSEPGVGLLILARR